MSTLQEMETKEYHTLFKGGHFFSSYQSVIKAIMNNTKDAKMASEAHDEIVKKILEAPIDMFNKIVKELKKNVDK